MKINYLSIKLIISIEVKDKLRIDLKSKKILKDTCNFIRFKIEVFMLVCKIY